MRKNFRLFFLICFLLFYTTFYFNYVEWLKRNDENYHHLQFTTLNFMYNLFINNHDLKNLFSNLINIVF
jgi:hypothetical protein